MKFLRQRLLDGLTLAMTVAAAFVVWQRLHPKQAAAAPVTPTHIRDWQSYASVGERLGPQPARVTMVVFSDYQCPFCRALAADVKTLRTKWPNDLAVVYRQFPLHFHQNAMPAAIGALCAARQDRFEAFHDLVFAKQDSLSQVSWSSLAREAGIVDTSAFNACLSDPATRAQVTRDSVAGVRLGMTGTPTLVLNDVRFSGSPGIDTLEAYIARALDHSSQQ